MPRCHSFSGDAGVGARGTGGQRDNNMFAPRRSQVLQRQQKLQQQLQRERHMSEPDNGITVQNVPQDVMYLGSVEVPCHMLERPRDWRHAGYNPLDLLSYTLDELRRHRDYIVVDMTLSSGTGSGTGVYLFLSHLRAARNVQLECFEIKPVVLLMRRVSVSIARGVTRHSAMAGAKSSKSNA